MRRPVLALSLAAFAACSHGHPTSAAARPDVQPAPNDPVRGMPIASGAILFAGIELPEAGTVFGGYYAGAAFDVRQGTYEMTDAVRRRLADEVRTRGAAILRNAGFRVRDVGPSSSDAQQLFGVQYGLSGRVTSLQVRSSGSAEPYRIEAQAEVSWELLDLGSGTGVFGRTLDQTIRESGSVNAVVAHVIGGTLERLVQDSTFRYALAQMRADPDAGVATRFRAVPPRGTFIELVAGDRNPSSDPTILGRVAAGLATLRSPENVFGTAFLISRDGLAIAAAHSVRDLRRLRARMHNGVERSLRVLRRSRGLDVALIQIECGECETVDWETPDGVDTFTPVLAVSAPLSDAEGIAFGFGRVGGRWGLANGVTLEMLESFLTGGEPVARMNSGRVFALVATRSGRKTALMLSQVFGALGVRAP